MDENSSQDNSKLKTNLNLRAMMPSFKRDVVLG